MTEPAYVRIAGEFARKIHTGQWPAKMRLPSYSQIVQDYGVSDIVARKAIELLLSQGLVRSERRRGVYVSDRPNLTRISPERQRQTPEETFRTESDQDISVDRTTAEVPATSEQAGPFGISVGDKITLVVTRVTEGRKPVSISDTYQPLGVTGVSDATHLEETLADRPPTETHAEWLGTEPGDLVKTVHQRFFTRDGRLIMMSDVSYPRDRYDKFLFRMVLRDDSPDANE